ncbi:hypothetical protein AWZ03_014708 [Drosophila navojoa]|uniref:Reverse transcriptase domain-containing protein n=1 Tax=Drosophila navojoa TaxID=7232 RepID=A0A484ASM2_DRONA|nr:hypothetical protein AWZ03_014708 [Drosophila navojoa]
MAELLDGWEVNLEEALDEEDAESRRMLPLIPIGWRVHPAGTELGAEVNQLLRREVVTRGRRHRRTRFRDAAGEQAYTVTVNSSGGVRALDTVIGPVMEPHAFAYLDDIVVIGATKEQRVAN